MQEKPLTELRNIGKTLASKLIEIEVTNELDLKRVGSVKAYQWLLEKSPNKNLPLCYYLYSLEGAILDKDWRNLSEKEKETLRIDAGV